MDILQVSVLEGDGVWRELLAVKVAGRETDALRTLALAHGARLLPAADGNAVLELTGTPAQLDAFLECLSGCGCAGVQPHRRGGPGAERDALLRLRN